MAEPAARRALAVAWLAERLRDAEPAMPRLALARTPPEQAHDKGAAAEGRC